MHAQLFKISPRLTLPITSSLLSSLYTEILEPYWSGGVLGVQREGKEEGAELSPSQGASRVIFCLSCHVTLSAKEKKNCQVPRGINGRRDCREVLETPREEVDSFLIY